MTSRWTKALCAWFIQQRSTCSGTLISETLLNAAQRWLIVNSKHQLAAEKSLKHGMASENT